MVGFILIIAGVIQIAVGMYVGYMITSAGPLNPTQAVTIMGYSQHLAFWVLTGVGVLLCLFGVIVLIRSRRSVP